MSSRASKEALINDVIICLEEVLRRLRPGIPQEWFTTELTMPQLRGLFLLLRTGPCRMGAVAAGLAISLSSATGLVDKLVERGLVERWPDTEDRRSVVCALSGKGRELAERLLQFRRSQWEEKLKHLGKEELSAAAQGLASLLQSLGRRDLATVSEPQDYGGIYRKKGA
ncbi:MAG: winged helix-turn-helix transcriptional regulator [Chloroflexi bacterium]|nr:winged helix-turn-helix transcriptional regulator [Chloroflexota bacterium]